MLPLHPTAQLLELSQIRGQRQQQCSMACNRINVEKDSRNCTVGTARNNRERRPVGLFLKGRKTTQLRSKTASSSTTQKVEVVLKGEKTAQLRSKTASSIQHNSVLVVTLQSLRGYFAVTSRLHRGCYAVAMVTTRSLRGFYGRYGHYGHYAVRKSIFETEKTLNFVPKRTLLS